MAKTTFVFLKAFVFLMGSYPLFANAKAQQIGNHLVKLSQKIDNYLTNKPTPQINPTNQNTIAKPQKLKKPKQITMVAVGDIMIGSSFPNASFLPPDDGKNSFNAVKPYLKGDVVFGNLEGVLLDEGHSTKCPKLNTGAMAGQLLSKKCYAFRMPSRYGKIIKEAGFNLLSLANNHIGDFGDVGRISTIQTLDNLGIYHAGLLQRPTVIFEKNGIKYGMVAFAPNIGTVSIHDLQTAKSYVQTLNQKVDIVIVSFHGGAEGNNKTRVPKTSEIFLGENRGNVYQFAHELIDVGADIVIGHGPHITRAVELYKNRLIAYSLGNFNTYGSFNLYGASGIAPLLQLQLKNNGEFISAQVISIYQTKSHGVLIDHQHRAFKELKRLSYLDFASQGLVFENNQIYKQNLSALPR